MFPVGPKHVVGEIEQVEEVTCRGWQQHAGWGLQLGGRWRAMVRGGGQQCCRRPATFTAGSADAAEIPGGMGGLSRAVRELVGDLVEVMEPKELYAD